MDAACQDPYGLEDLPAKKDGSFRRLGFGAWFVIAICVLQVLSNIVGSFISYLEVYHYASLRQEESTGISFQCLLFEQLTSIIMMVLPFNLIREEVKVQD